jgi:2-dehydropantoate 2-reductase
MKILIVGAGSLGLLFAGKLSAAPGTDVRLVTRTAAQAEQIREHGLQIEEEGRSVRAELSCVSFEAVQVLVDAQRWDWVFLMAKQTHIDTALIQVLVNMITAEGTTKLLCFQNGVGHVDTLAKAGIPRELIYVAVTTEGAQRQAGHIVAHTGFGITALGGGGESGGVHDMAELDGALRASGMNSYVFKDIDAVVYRKLLINCVINPLTSILNIRNGDLLSSRYAMELMKSLYTEACIVLERCGLPITDDLWEQLLEVCGKTANNSSSMREDIRAGRVTEIDWINGSIIRLAAEHSIAVPAHKTVYNLVKGMEAQAEIQA